MRKLFKKSDIPRQNRPDYEFIAKAEREFQLDDEGFNQRYDEMLIDEFNRNADSNDEIEKMYDLLDSLFSVKYRLYITDCIGKATELQRDKNISSNVQEVNILRARMIARGKRRFRD